MPQGFKGWGLFVLAQALLGLALKLIIKLIDNAMMTWGDEKIASWFGITSPNASTVFDWALPFAMAGLILLAYHALHSRRPPVRIYTVKEPEGAARENIISQMPRRLYAQVVSAKNALGGRVIFGWVLSIGGALALLMGIAALMTTSPVAKIDMPSKSMGTELDYPLARHVVAFLAKRGKAPRWGQTPAGPPTVGLGTDGQSNEMFITHWDASLGPWPSTDDGFTSWQLRMFPSTVPKFTTQYDKESFRVAVDALQKIVNQKIGAIVRLSQSLTPVSVTKENAGEFQQKLEQITSLYQEVDALLFVRGSSSNGRFFDESSYKDLLMGLLPDDWQLRWSNYDTALNIFKSAVSLVVASERHPEDNDLSDLARTNTGIPKDTFMQETNKLRNFLDQANQKIDIMIKAI